MKSEKVEMKVPLLSEERRDFFCGSGGNEQIASVWQKKVANCLRVSAEMCNFAAVTLKMEKKMKQLNLISNLIIIRLRSVAGSDKVCI